MYVVISDRSSVSTADTCRKAYFLLGVSPAIPVLYSLLANLPADTTINVQHLTANADSLDLEAQLKTYEDADVIAAAARKAGLEVPPPQVRKDNNNLWSLSLHATKTKAVADAAR